MWVVMAIQPFFFNDTPTTEIYTLSLHDALPICKSGNFPATVLGKADVFYMSQFFEFLAEPPDRKSTRLNSSHLGISYAVFCLKKKNRASRKALPSRWGRRFRLSGLRQARRPPAR